MMAEFSFLGELSLIVKNFQNINMTFLLFGFYYLFICIFFTDAGFFSNMQHTIK